MFFFNYKKNTFAKLQIFQSFLFEQCVTQCLGAFMEDNILYFFNQISLEEIFSVIYSLLDSQSSSSAPRGHPPKHFRCKMKITDVAAKEIQNTDVCHIACFYTAGRIKLLCTHRTAFHNLSDRINVCITHLGRECYANFNSLPYLKLGNLEICLLQ